MQEGGAWLSDCASERRGKTEIYAIEAVDLKMVKGRRTEVGIEFGLTDLKRLKAFKLSIESQGGFTAQRPIAASNQAIREVCLAVPVIF